MPRLPDSTSISRDIPAPSIRTPSFPEIPRMDQVGRALEGLGQSISNFASDRQQELQRSNAFAEHTRFLQFYQDQQNYLDQATQGAQPGAEGFADNIGTGYDTRARQYMQDVSPSMRAEYDAKLVGLKGHLVDQARTFQFNEADRYAKERLGDSQNGLLERATRSPDQWEAIQKENAELVGETHLSEIEKEKAIHDFNEKRATVKALTDPPEQARNGLLPKQSKSYVDRVTGRESGNSDIAQNPLSSAGGRGQFIDSTWLTLVRKYHPELAGMGDADVLKLKSNKDLSREMVGRYGDENGTVLASRGLPVNDGTLYLAHFAGAGGAVKLLTADPNTPASQILEPSAIKSNPFLKNWTAGQVIKWAGGGVRPSQVTDLSGYTPQERHLVDHHLHNLDAGSAVHNPDGSTSTVLQMVVDGPDGKIYSIPSVWDGKILNETEAKKRAAEKGWDYWPSYSSYDEADNRYLKPIKDGMPSLHDIMEQDITDSEAEPGVDPSYAAIPFEKRLALAQHLDTQMAMHARQIERQQARIERTSEKDTRDLAEREGYDLMRSSKLTPEWLEQHRNDVGLSAYKTLSRALHPHENTKTDEVTYVDLLNRLDTDPEQVKQDSEHAYTDDRISKDAFMSIRSKADATIKQRDARPWTNDVRSFVKSGLELGQFSSARQKERQIGAIFEYDDWMAANPKASREEAMGKAKDIIQGYRHVRLSDFQQTAPLPKFVPPGISRYTMKPEDVDTAIEATRKKYLDGKLTAEEAASEAKVLRQWAEELRPRDDLIPDKGQTGKSKTTPPQEAAPQSTSEESIPPTPPLLEQVIPPAVRQTSPPNRRPLTSPPRPGRLDSLVAPQP